MKKSTLKSTIVFVVSVFAASTALVVSTFCGCADRISAGYVLELPEVPHPWLSLLGEPMWYVEWIDPDGRKQSKDVPYGTDAEIEIPVTWANPVTASPYWDKLGLDPKLFRPAGAIFPFDVSFNKKKRDNRLRLSWRAGADAAFYWELLLACGEDESKLPANFDWLRFRELFNGTLSKEVCEDPWLVNWRSVAEKTAASSFDRRRLVPEAAVEKSIPVTSGEWYGSSPFSKPIVPENVESSIFPVRPGVNIWISNEGILRVNGNVWVLNKIKNEE